MKKPLLLLGTLVVLGALVAVVVVAGPSMMGWQQPTVTPAPPTCPDGRAAGSEPLADRGIVSMEYSNPEIHGFRSFLAYGQELTHMEPRWLHIRQPGDAKLETDIDPNLVTEARKACLTVIPILDDLDRPVLDNLNGPRP